MQQTIFEIRGELGVGVLLDNGGKRLLAFAPTRHQAERLLGMFKDSFTAEDFVSICEGGFTATYKTDKAYLLARAYYLTETFRLQEGLSLEQIFGHRLTPEGIKNYKDSASLDPRRPNQK